MEDFKVVILSYNHPQITVQSVESVLNIIPATRLMLIHNGSLNVHVDFLKTKFPQVEHVIIENNLGFSGGANKGLAEAFKKVNWVLFITNDCLLQSLQVPGYQKPNLIAPLIFLRNKKNIDSMGGLIDIKKVHLKHCKNKNEFKLSQRSKPYVPGSAFWLHKKVFEALNGFDESYHTYWEDVDFSLRALKAGVEPMIDEKTKIIHRGGKTCHKDSFYTSYLFHKNRLKLAKKYFKVSPYFLYLPVVEQAIKHIRGKKWQNLKLLYKALREG